MTLDSVFWLASITKPLTATVIAGLVGDKAVTWDSKTSDLDPAFRLWGDYVSGEVTLRDLLCHRTGLPEHAGDLLEDLGYSRAEVLRRLRFQKPAGAFRSSYAYTNFGFTEAAVATAKCTISTLQRAKSGRPGARPWLPPQRRAKCPSSRPSPAPRSASR